MCAAASRGSKKIIYTHTHTRTHILYSILIFGTENVIRNELEEHAFGYRHSYLSWQIIV